MEGHASEPDPIPAIPFTFAAGQEHDAQASIPEAQHHGGSYAVAKGQTNTDVSDAPLIQPNETTSNPDTRHNVQKDLGFNTHDIPAGSGLHTAPAIYVPKHSSHSHAAFAPSSETIAKNTNFFPSHVPATNAPQVSIPPIPAPNKLSSSIPSAFQQQALLAPNTTAHESQNDHEELVPVGRALEVDVGYQFIQGTRTQKLNHPCVVLLRLGQ